MASTIPLAKKLNYEKLEFPVFVSKKLDGVPIKFMIKDDRIEITTRSGKGSTISCQMIKDELWDIVKDKNKSGVTLVGEVTHTKDKMFKTVSGHVRRMTNNPDLICSFFDYFDEKVEHDGFKGFSTRHTELRKLLENNIQYSLRLNIIPQSICNDRSELNNIISNIPKDQEGWVIRNYNDHFIPNKRSWGYQKVVKTPTKDLVVAKFDEAISKDGHPLNMVGKIWLRYKGNLIGCGPGKLTHEERTDLWAWAGPFNGEIESERWIAEVKYKIDPSYDALREASFVSWRFDKEEVNED